MPSPAYLETVAGGVRLRLKIQPRASRNEVAGAAGDELRLRITAPPVDNAANEALLEFLAETLGCRRAELELLRGHTSRHKVVHIAGMTAGAVLERLGNNP